jgi:hypothetical protein
MMHYRYEIEKNARFPGLVFRTFEVVKETPKGYWLKETFTYSPHRLHWVPKKSIKRYAYPSKTEALINFIKRTEKHASILGSRLYDCKNTLEQARKLRKEGL